VSHPPEPAILLLGDAADEREVTFLAREGKTPGGDERQLPITLSTLEFTRRWALQVLPAGFTKTRHFGGWSNCRREAQESIWKKI